MMFYRRILLTLCCLALPSFCQGSSGFLLFTDTTRNVVYKSTSKDHGLLSSPQVIIHSLFTPEAVTYDPIEQHVFWSATSNRTISRAFLNGSSEEIIVRYVRAVAIAVDAAGRNLYWADNKKDSIEVAKLDGTYRKVLIRTRKPTDMALDLSHRQIYWSSSPDAGVTVIERSSMNGSDRRHMTPKLYRTEPMALCIENSMRLVFWAFRGFPDLYFTSLDGSFGIAEHYHFQTGLSKPYGLTILDQHIYWTDSDRGQVAGVDLTTGRLQVVTNDVQTPKGIYAFNDGAVIPDTNCSKNNGGCSHLCLLNPLQVVCACPDKMSLKDDGKTCYYHDFLLFIERIGPEFYYKSLTKNTVDSLSKSQILIDDRTGPYSTMDFDPVEQRFYWTAGNTGIYRAFLNGSSMERVVDHEHFWPKAHAIDVIGRNIYFIHKIADMGIIVVCKMDGSDAKVLVSCDGRPKSIIVDSRNGLMYWLSYLPNGELTIEKARMDGSGNKEVLVRKLRPHNYKIDLPRSLAIDSSNQRLYWVDQDKRHLHYIDTVPKTGKIHNITIPMDKRVFDGLVVKDDYLYFSANAWRHSDVYRINKTELTTGNAQSIASGLILSNLYVYSDETDGQDNNHPCAQFNGWCTHLCLLKPGGYSCNCPPKTKRPCYTTPVKPTASQTTTSSKFLPPTAF